MFWMGKRKQGNLELSPLEYIICLILFKHEKEELEITGGSLAMSGYDLLAELNKIFDGIWEAQTGTMYPLLNKMANPKHPGGRKILHGEVKKSQLGPAKTVYELTTETHDEIKALLKDNFSDDLRFMERYMLLMSQVSDIQEYRPIILQYSEEILKDLRAKGNSPKTIELRKQALQKLYNYLQNVLQNVKLDLDQVEAIPKPEPGPVEEKNTKTKTCEKCGEEIISVGGVPIKFCAYCGEKITA